MTSEAEARRLVAEIPHWHHSFEIFPGVKTPGSYDPSFLWSALRLPADLTGARVLDIGASDGFFTLNLARSGAQVVSIDYRKRDEHGFSLMEQLNNISVEYHAMNIYDLNKNSFGSFDIVLFLGVLYHLPDMLRALYLIRQCCEGNLYLETHSDNSCNPDIASARYFRAATLAGDHTNFWSPNRLCVMDMLFDSGFDRIREETWGDRLFCEARAVPMDDMRAYKMHLGYR